MVAMVLGFEGWSDQCLQSGKWATNRHNYGKDFTLVLDASINREVFFSGNSSKFERNLISGHVCQNGRDSMEVIPRESNCSHIFRLTLLGKIMLA